MAQRELSLTTVVATQLLPNGDITIGDAIRKCVDLILIKMMNTSRVALGMQEDPLEASDRRQALAKTSCNLPARHALERSTYMNGSLPAAQSCSMTDDGRWW